MKHRISVTIDESTIVAMQDTLRARFRSGIFRNKSHLVEYALNKFLEDDR